MSIQTILQERYKAIQVELVRYLNNPYDPDRTHDLRVTIRTLRGLIKFLKRRITPESYDVINSNLSQAAMLFSDLRELDVLIEQAGAYAYAHPDKETNYQHLFSVLREDRQEEMKRTLADEAMTTLKNELQQAHKQVSALKFSGNDDLHQYIVKEMHRRYHKLMKMFERLDSDDYPQVHHVRKRAKTLRYASTQFADFATRKANKSAKLAKDIQDDTGTITDAHVNYMRLYQLAETVKNDDDKKLLLDIADDQLNKFK
ncbi:CHAD domain-containing protein [Lentilactobacillus sunkii]|nr:CHAD domain-containing protein [Lentilactobacillus sunkii]